MTVKKASDLCCSWAELQSLLSTASIRARGARLADDAVGIWKRPVLPDRVLHPYRTPRAGAGHYTIEHHPHLRPGAPMHDLFEAVRQEILGLAPEVREEFMRHYVAYKTQTNFTDVVPQKRRLLLMLNMRFDDISDPRGLAADVTNLGLWGSGDVQVEVDNARQLPYAMELVRQAFAARQPDGAKGQRHELCVRGKPVRDRTPPPRRSLRPLWQAGPKGRWTRG